jgi:hypothetical protein
MSDDLYFDGDPSTDSTRRQLERVMKDEPRRRRWPWVVGSLAAVAAWYFWPRGPATQTSKEASGSAKPSP